MAPKVRSVSNVRRPSSVRRSSRRRAVADVVESRGIHDEPVGESFQASLSGADEVPPVATRGRGHLSLDVAPDGSSIDYELSFSDLSSPSTAAHLHLGQSGVNGPIFAFLCGGAGQQGCPGVSGNVAGTLFAEDILAVPDRGLEAGDLASALRLIRAGAVYVNVHTTLFPSGEIRGQVRRSRA